MKKTLAVLLSFCLLFCLAACGTNNTTSGDISNNDVSQSEITSDLQTNEKENNLETNKLEEKAFIVGETLASPVDNNFKMPINMQEDKYATITNLKATALKIADINDKNDYYSIEGQTYYTYYRYIYQLELSGKVDVSFAGKTINVQVAFDNNTSAGFYDIKNHAVTINPDGTFSVNTRIGSNNVEKYIYPNLLSISKF